MTERVIEAASSFAPCPGTGTGRAARPSGPAPSFETERRLDLIAELTNGQLDPEDARVDANACGERAT